MKTVKGDLIKMALNDEFDVIVHGCNCHCCMGAGIADTIANTFPKALIADCKTTVGDDSKLGTYSTAFEKNVVVVNAYTQYDYTHNKIDVDYDAVRECFQAIKKEFTGTRIGYPLIGAGLAGGDWNIISKIIDEELDGEDHTLVLFDNASSYMCSPYFDKDE